MNDDDDDDDAVAPVYSSYPSSVTSCVSRMRQRTIPHKRRTEIKALKRRCMHNSRTATLSSERGYHSAKFYFYARQQELL